MGARKLRCLVIHDSVFQPEDAMTVLGTGDLELCRIRIDELDHEWKILRSWRDLCRILAREATLTPPDLLLIDCNFEDDRLAPELPRGEYDPRGLVYGAVMTAYLHGAVARRPLGFVTYSQNMDYASRNSYALTFYGILRAMASEDGTLRTPDKLRSEMSAHKNAEQPKDVVNETLVQFRDSLYDLADSYLQIDYVSVEQAQDAVRLHDKTPLTGNEWIGWGTFEQDTEKILLSSLFADCRAEGTWQEGCLPTVAEYLERLREGENERRNLLAVARRHAEDLYSDKGTKWMGKGLPKYKVQTLTYSLLWALLTCKANHDERNHRRPIPLDSTYILQLMKLSKNSRSWNKLMNRALGHVLGNHGASRQEPSYPNSVFFERLTTAREWPYVHCQNLKWLITVYLKDAYAKGRECCAPEHWPRCLR